MSELYVCENAGKCSRNGICKHAKPHVLNKDYTYICDDGCGKGVSGSVCVPVGSHPATSNDSETQHGSRRFCVELGSLNIHAENHVEAVEKAARWIAAHAKEETFEVGDLAELNDPIHPFMSRQQVCLTDGKGRIVF